MSVRAYLEEHIKETEEETYESVRQLDFFRLLRIYGRAITIQEFMYTFERLAVQHKLELNRDRLYAATVQRLNNQQMDGDIKLKSLNTLDETIYFNFRTSLKNNGIEFFEGETRVIVPKLLEESYTSAFRKYYQLRFVELRDAHGAISKVKNWLGPMLKTADTKLQDALGDGEIVTFLAAFYKYALEHTPLQAKVFSSELISSLNLIDRLVHKYELNETEQSTLRYVLYKSIQDLSKKL